ncbi:uncharacterized protein CLUP02_17067 [Colletotrichum lupini]|uniref:Uncharacterized protein n=1 Tax=Colletotrichum lupini TaxID=145971 RepID=A0A9Q8T926_9PEZI|nr:uncharacterized protein CLUP02_17067 [Colletotrichum lupini]UQC91531.1 hypothetical protein CLUP02_17067 [Colletotrichum lupini]
MMQPTAAGLLGSNPGDGNQEDDVGGSDSSTECLSFFHSVQARAPKMNKNLVDLGMPTRMIISCPTAFPPLEGLDVRSVEAKRSDLTLRGRGSKWKTWGKNGSLWEAKQSHHFPRHRTTDGKKRALSFGEGSNKQTPHCMTREKGAAFNMNMTKYKDKENGSFQCGLRRLTPKRNRGDESNGRQPTTQARQNAGQEPIRRCPSYGAFSQICSSVVKRPKPRSSMKMRHSRGARDPIPSKNWRVPSESKTLGRHCVVLRRYFPSFNGGLFSCFTSSPLSDELNVLHACPSWIFFSFSLVCLSSFWVKGLLGARRVS